MGVRRGSRAAASSGGGLPTAAAAGQAPLSTGAGTTYAARNIAGARIDPTFETGQGWTIVAPATPGEGVASFEVVSGAKVGRVAVTATGAIHGLDGPRIERAFPLGAGLWRVSARLNAQSGQVYGGVYLRNGSTAIVVGAISDLVAGSEGCIFAMVPAWTVPGVSPTHQVTFNGTCQIGIRGAVATTNRVGSFDAAGTWSSGGIPAVTANFEPTHVGICAMSDLVWTGHIDFTDFLLETYG